MSNKNNIILFTRTKCFIFRIKVLSLGLEVFNVLDESIHILVQFESSTIEIYVNVRQKNFIQFHCKLPSKLSMNQLNAMTQFLSWFIDYYYSFASEKKKSKTKITNADFSFLFRERNSKDVIKWQAGTGARFHFKIWLCQYDVFIHCHSNVVQWQIRFLFIWIRKI